MPLPAGTKYRVTRRGGDNIRLAFDKRGNVVEAVNLNSGARHTPAEFKADEKRRQKRHAEMNQKLRGG